MFVSQCHWHPLRQKATPAPRELGSGISQGRGTVANHASRYRRLIITNRSTHGKQPRIHNMKLSIFNIVLISVFCSLLSGRAADAAAAADDACQEGLEYYLAMSFDFMTECECITETNGDTVLVCVDSCERCDEEAKVKKWSLTSFARFLLCSNHDSLSDRYRSAVLQTIQRFILLMETLTRL